MTEVTVERKSYEDYVADLEAEAATLTEAGAMTSWNAGACVEEFGRHGLGPCVQAGTFQPEMSQHLRDWSSWVGFSPPFGSDQGLLAFRRGAMLVRSESAPWVWSVRQQSKL